MLLTKRSDPTTGETSYHYDHMPADPPLSPEASLGGSILTTQLLTVRASRVEMWWWWSHMSGHAELNFESAPDIIERTAERWPDLLVPIIAQRFGDNVAAEVKAVMDDPAAFTPLPAAL